MLGLVDVEISIMGVADVGDYCVPVTASLRCKSHLPSVQTDIFLGVKQLIYEELMSSGLKNYKVLQ